MKLMNFREEHGKYALNDEEEAYVRDYEEHVVFEQALNESNKNQKTLWLEHHEPIKIQSVIKM